MESIYWKKTLLHLYDAIFQTQSYPKAWNEGLIIPIHKKGDRMNTDIYRGVAISSCSSTIYLKILTTRIEKYMVSTNKWSIHQCGFKTDHRTEDNVFLLHTIYEP